MSDEFVLPFENPLQEAAQRDRAHNELGIARCPICGAPLHMRVDCHGPRFVCQCMPADLKLAG